MIPSQGMLIELGGVIFLFIGGLLATLGWQWPFCFIFCLGSSGYAAGVCAVTIVLWDRKHE